MALPAQAQSKPGISTTQTAGPNPATVGQPLTFTVTVTNNAAPQHVGLKDFFPEGAELVSATPSQGNCGSGHHSNAVQCVLGDLPSGGSATVEIVVLPTVPGTAKNTAVGGGEHSPEISDEATVEVNPAALTRSQLTRPQELTEQSRSKMPDSVHFSQESQTAVVCLIVMCPLPTRLRETFCNWYEAKIIL